MAGNRPLVLKAAARLHKLHTTRSPRDVHRVESGRPFIRPHGTLKKDPDRAAAIFGRSKLGQAPSVSDLILAGLATRDASRIDDARRGMPRCLDSYARYRPSHLTY